MKLACVVHRFGPDIAGGSEAHCRHVAEHLAAEHDVTILTSCARDHVSWRNEYEPGASALGALKVLRFPVARQRSLHRFAGNKIWCAVVVLASELIAWTQLLAFTDHEARRWEPKRLRFRIFTVSATLAGPVGRSCSTSTRTHPGPTCSTRLSTGSGS